MFQLKFHAVRGAESIARFQAQFSDAIDGVMGDSGQHPSRVGCQIRTGPFSFSDQVRRGGIVLRGALFVRCRLLTQGAA
jgi:hypothetical protein